MTQADLPCEFLLRGQRSCPEACPGCRRVWFPTSRHKQSPLAHAPCPPNPLLMQSNSLPGVSCACVLLSARVECRYAQMWGTCPNAATIDMPIANTLWW